MTLNVEVGLGPGDFVFDGHPTPLPIFPKRGPSPPNFRPISIVAKRLDATAGCIKMPLGMEVGLSPGDFVSDGEQPLPKKGRSATQFSAHVYCGQTAAWIKMPLGTDVGLSPHDIELDGNPAPRSPKRGRSPLPNFLPMTIVAKRLDGSRWHLAWRLALLRATLC